MNERLHMNEGTLDVPPGFRDLSIQILEWRSEDGAVIALTVQRESLRAGEELDGYVRRTITDLYAELSSFRIDARHALEGAPVPSSLLTFRWHGDGGIVCQAQGFAELGRTVLVVTATTATAALRPEAERMVRHALSQRWVRDAPTGGEVAHGDAARSPGR